MALCAPAYFHTFVLMDQDGGSSVLDRTGPDRTDDVMQLIKPCLSQNSFR